MKSFKQIFDPRNEKFLRLGLLLLSALFIGSASILFYDGMVSEKPLSVGGGGTGTTAASSTTRTVVNVSPPTIFILAVSAFIISVSMFAFLREARKHIRILSDKSGPLPTGSGSIPLGKEEWEEAPRNDDESSASSSSG
ncbi:MAG TPA: hypothetical protein VGS11_02480 [Candidatus Bathyarchaeia archaeon]|nr:hypothetical protein [Candidatus Bathyarchaeia archaeon]